MRITFIAGGLFALLAFTTAATAAEIKVMISGGFSAAYLKLMPEFERASGHKVVTCAAPRWARRRRRSPIASRAAKQPTW